LRVAVLGATGSVGRQALAVLPKIGGEAVSLAARHASPSLLEAACHHRPHLIATAERPTEDFVRALPEGIEIAWGEGALDAAALAGDPDVVLVAVTGIHGLRPTLSALASGRRVALANKETLVTGGDLVMAAAEAGQIVPADSEHAAVHHLLGGRPWHPGQRIWITGSGGALRDWSIQRLREATPDDVLRHPTWRMGPKVTVDSATLANKGLEVIEAHHLFAAPYESISVTIHRDSLVHGLVEEADGSFKAEIAAADMALPLARALAWPNPVPDLAGRLVPTDLPPLAFEAVDQRRYPFLNAAYAAGKMGGIFPAVLNAANDEAVGLFLEGRIPFSDIYRLTAQVLDLAVREDAGGPVTLEGLLERDAWAHRVIRTAQEKGRFP